jgi:hypothetical protein
MTSGRLQFLQSLGCLSHLRWSRYHSISKGAFQASSPKNFRAGHSTGPFFSAARKVAEQDETGVLQASRTAPKNR